METLQDRRNLLISLYQMGSYIDDMIFIFMESKFAGLGI